MDVKTRLISVLTTVVKKVTWYALMILPGLSKIMLYASMLKCIGIRLNPFISKSCSVEKDIDTINKSGIRQAMQNKVKITWIIGLSLLYFDEVRFLYSVFTLSFTTDMYQYPPAK